MRRRRTVGIQITMRGSVLASRGGSILASAEGVELNRRQTAIDWTEARSIHRLACPAGRGCTTATDYVGHGRPHQRLSDRIAMQIERHGFRTRRGVMKAAPPQTDKGGTER